MVEGGDAVSALDLKLLVALDMEGEDTSLLSTSSVNAKDDFLEGGRCGGKGLVCLRGDSRRAPRRGEDEGGGNNGA